MHRLKTVRREKTLLVSLDEDTPSEDSPNVNVLHEDTHLLLATSLWPELQQPMNHLQPHTKTPSRYTYPHILLISTITSHTPYISLTKRTTLISYKAKKNMPWLIAKRYLNSVIVTHVAVATKSTNRNYVQYYIKKQEPTIIYITAAQLSC